jgi:hypothetical protein
LLPSSTRFIYNTFDSAKAQKRYGCTLYLFLNRYVKSHIFIGHTKSKKKMRYKISGGRHYANEILLQINSSPRIKSQKLMTWFVNLIAIHNILYKWITIANKIVVFCFFVAGPELRQLTRFFLLTRTFTHIHVLSLLMFSVPIFISYCSHIFTLKVMISAFYSLLYFFLPTPQLSANISK